MTQVFQCRTDRKLLTETKAVAKEIGEHFKPQQTEVRSS